MDNSKKLQVNCSPGTFGKISDDPEFAQNCSQQLLEEADEHFDEVIFTPIAETQEEPSQLNASIANNIPEGSVWTGAATKLLLSNFKELSGEVGKSCSLKNKTRLWQTITANICKEGYRFSPSQVESKFRGLERKYKKAKLNYSQTGRSRMTCLYQNELDEILGIKKGINPEYTLDSEKQHHLASPSPVESSQEASDDVPTTSSRARATEKGKLLKKLDEISKRKEERHRKIIEILEKKEQIRIEKEKQREEREKRREEMGNRIVNLLDKLVNRTTQ